MRNRTKMTGIYCSPDYRHPSRSLFNAFSSFNKFLIVRLLTKFLIRMGCPRCSSSGQ